jgi:hypothetical protein
MDSTSDYPPGLVPYSFLTTTDAIIGGQNTGYFNVTNGGVMTATAGTIGGFTITDSTIHSANNKLQLNSDGSINANDGKIGKFNIGGIKSYLNGLNIVNASGLYSDNYISSFNEDTTNKSGIYVGTDGLKLGQDFSISADGLISAASGKLGP